MAHGIRSAEGGGGIIRIDRLRRLASLRGQSVELAVEIGLRTTVMYIVISAVVGLERILVKVTERNKAVERLIESTPVLLVRDGMALTEALDREDLSQDEMFVRLREKGVESLGEVKRPYLGLLATSRF